MPNNNSVKCVIHFSTTAQNGSGAQPASYSVSTTVLSRAYSGCAMKVTDHSPPPSGKVKNERSYSYTSNPSLNFHDVDKDNLFYLLRSG